MCLGGRGCGLGAVGACVLEMEQGVLVVVYALIDVGLAEKPYWFAGDVSKSIVKLSYAVEGQLLQTAQVQSQ